MTLNKKGFTLIELMVVIVIIGILAAIAIPKLFGMSAKAKASEVGPAAGTWEKLQIAYVMETNLAGTQAHIGYSVPTSANFTYGDGPAADAATATWTATAIDGALNTECGEGVWTAIFTAGDQKITTATVKDGDGDGTNCASLTPSFVSSLCKGGINNTFTINGGLCSAATEPGT